MLQKAYGESAMKKKNNKNKWYKRFRDGREDERSDPAL
jgi:hypothetical protein